MGDGEPLYLRLKEDRMSIPPGYTDSGQKALCPICFGLGYTSQIQDDGVTKLDVQCTNCAGTGQVPLLIKDS